MSPSHKFIIWLLAAGLPAIGASAAHACTYTTPLSPDLGTYSGPAVKAGQVSAVGTVAGLNCPSSIITLLGTNTLKAKFSSQNNLTLLRQGGTETIGYKASGAPDGTYAYSQNGTIDYMINNLLNVLGLLGGSSVNVPIYFKPNSGAAPVNGVYQDKVTLNWDWSLCTGVSIGNACVGSVDQGTAITVITITMTIASKVVMTTTTSTTWDPIDNAVFPKAVPGGKFRSTVVVQNNDVLDVDSGSLNIVLPTPSKASVALDGDGTNSTPVVLNIGSSLAMTYSGPASTTDDVDFSNDGGVTWTYQPSASNQASMDAITHVRIRPRNALTKQTSATFSVSYLMK